MKYTFKQEEQTLADEQVEFERVSYHDNAEILALIENRKNGIVSLIEDELLLP